MTWVHAIPWVIAVIGWFAGHAFSEARERRKEVKGILDKIQERLASTEKLATEFHTSETFDEAKARAITINLERVERTIQRVQILDTKALESFIIQYRQAITLKNFDRSEFAQQTFTTELVQEIANTGLELEDELDKQYQERYPPSFPFFKWPGLKNFLVFWR